jgi:hypothetical protein
MSEWTSVLKELPTVDELVRIKNNEGRESLGSYSIVYNGVWRIGNDVAGWDYDFNCDYIVTEWQKMSQSKQ